MDFDGTLYQGNSFKAMFKVGKKRYTAKQWLTVYKGVARALALGLIKGKTVFKHEFFKAFARTFKDMEREELEAFFNELVKIGKNEINDELVTKIREHKNNGDTIIVISGALKPFLKAFVKDQKLDVHIISTELLYNSLGRCSGEIGTIMNGDMKVEGLKKWLDHQEQQSNEIWAYADSESDIPLLQYVTHPIVVNPKENMVKIAEQNNWVIFAT